MKEIYQLVQSLENREKKTTESYLHCFSKQDNSNSSLTRLFLILSKRKRCPSNEEMVEKLQLKDKQALFYLNYRLKHKIFEAAVIDINIERLKSIDELNYVSIKLRKRLSQINFLVRTKGTLAIVKTELDNLIKEALKYELYPIVIEGYSLKKQLYIKKAAYANFLKINNLINTYSNAENAIKHAIDFHICFVAESNLEETFKDKEKRKLLEDIIFESNKQLDNFYSPTLHYYIKLFEFYYFTIKEEYTTARETCLERLKLLKKHVSINRKQRIGNAYIHLYNTDINMKEYTRALNNIHHSIKYFPKYSYNAFVAHETKFKVLFYLKRYTAASHLLEKIKNTNTNNDKFINHKIIYHKSFIYFIKGNYTQAISLLNQPLELNKDKSGHEIFIRIISVCCYLALKKYDKALWQLNNLIQNIQKTKKYHVTERNKKIILLLKNILKQETPDIKLNTPLRKIILQLTENSNTQWEPLSPELFPIDEWLIQHFSIASTKATPAQNTNKKKALKP
jgi:tetratricopeptide (TPR) repeat protein